MRPTTRSSAFAMRRSLFVQAASSGLVEHAPGDRIDVHVCGVLSPNFYDASYYDVAAELDPDGTQSKLRIQVPLRARTASRLPKHAPSSPPPPRPFSKIRATRMLVKLEDGSIQPRVAARRARRGAHDVELPPSSTCCRRPPSAPAPSNRSFKRRCATA